MAFEFDHLFICVDVGAPEGDCLTTFGLVEGSSNVHSGQGTTNRRFFFRNAMVELLWVHDPREAMSEAIHHTRLWERWTSRHQGSCPFGICLRPGPDADDTIAFSSWSYRPPYLPKTMSIAVGNNADRLTEPMLFQIASRQRPDQSPPEKAQPLDHGIDLREITRVELVGPFADPLSPELHAVLDTQQVTLRRGTDYCVELGFDREVRGHQVDFRPGLPLIMRW